MIEESKHYALAIACGAKRGPKDSDLTFSPASLRDFLKALDQPEQEPVASCQHKRYSVDVHEQTGRCFDCGAEGRMRFVVGNREQRDIARAAIAKAIGEQS